MASAFLGALSMPTLAKAQLGNLTYTQQEVNTSISLFNAANMPGGPEGSNTVLLVKGYLIVMGSLDSGKSPGLFHIFDVKDPRNPVRVKSFTESKLSATLRELHSMPMAVIDGKFVLVSPTHSGVAFFDFTDPKNPADIAGLSLPGVSGGDYTNVAWVLSWSWPYLYVGSSGSGVDIVDATDPANAKLVKQIPISQLGNFRVGPVHAAGHYLTVASMDQDPNGVSVIDVADPNAPFLLTTNKTAKSMYSSLTIGDLIYGPGVNANWTFMKWSPEKIDIVAEMKIGQDKGGYCGYQDGFAICGQSKDGFHKVDVSTYTKDAIKEVSTGKPTADGGGDFDFASVLGNLVYLGNDHGTGASFIPHQAAPDTTPPKVFKIFPEDKSTKQPVGTHVTIFFTDDIQIETATEANIIVRKNGGAPLPGVFSRSSFNAISFGPKAKLEPNSTYEVVINQGGVKDLAGNPIAEGAIGRFSTGDMVDPPMGGAGGSTGAGGSDGAGGSSDTGGSVGSGGTPDTGGSVGSGGTVETGGSVGMTGGSMGTTGGAAGHGPAEDAAGCACNVPGRSAAGGFFAFLTAALGIGAGRMRRRRERSKIGA
jgi:hypothetical protein